MSAELLREAAVLMRERAEAATPGPWKMWDGWGPTEDGLMGFARLGPDSGERVFRHDDSRDLYATRGDAEHVGSWHPAVALAVADWLDAEATSIENVQANALIDGDDFMRDFQGGPLVAAVARAYLGRAS